MPPRGEKKQLWPMLPFSCWHLYKFLTHEPVYNPQASLQNENTCLSQTVICNQFSVKLEIIRMSVDTPQAVAPMAKKKQTNRMKCFVEIPFY